MKNAVLLMLVGALLGVAAASFLVPPLLGWYTSPGGLPQGAEVQAVVQIPEVIRYVTSRLLQWQAIGAVVGAVLGLTVYFLSHKKRAPAPGPTEPKPVA